LFKSFSTLLAVQMWRCRIPGYPCGVGVRKRMAAPLPDLHELWIEHGRPAAHKFRQIMIRKGIAAPSEKYINEHFLKYQTSKQLFAKGPSYTGKIYSPGIDRRWQSDILVNTQKPSEFKGTKWEYALIVVDVFSRFVWCRLITSPAEAHVGMQEILGEAKEAPEVVATDADHGFLSPQFQKLLSSRGIQHFVRAGRNDLAVVDRVIYTLKRTLASHSLESGRNDWAEQIGQAVKAYNDSPHGTLMDGAPDDIRGADGVVKNKVLYFRREQQEARNMQTNSDQILERAERLQKEGSYRVYKHKEKLGRRVFEPSWSREQHEAKTIEGAYVFDEHGNRHPIKETLAVPKESTHLPEAHVILNTRAREKLQRYADRLHAFLTAKPDHRVAASKAHSVLSEIGDIKQAVQLAGLATDKVIASFVKVFP